MEQDFEKRLTGIYSDMKDLLIRKNASYGGSVFQGEGIMPLVGNMIRLGDKMRRYEHLVTKLVTEGTADAPFNESIYDTVMDILGYATLGLMILENLEMKPSQG